MSLRMIALSWRPSGSSWWLNRSTRQGTGDGGSPPRPGPTLGGSPRSVSERWPCRRPGWPAHPSRALLPGLAAPHVSMIGGQRVRLGRHDEVVPVEPTDFVGPPGDRDSPPLREESRMVALLLGESANPVGEGQRVGEGRDVERPLELGDAVAFYELPVGELALEIADLGLRHSR